MEFDVFISYSHKDAAIADAVCHRLESGGIRCWYAPRNIKPGQEWAGAIVEAIEQAKVMILIFTDYSNVSVQVHREVDTAVSFGIRIIPFKCTPANPSAGMKYYLSALHWLDAVDKPLEDSIETLNAHVQSMLSFPASDSQGSTITSEAQANSTKAEQEQKPRKNRTALWFGVAGALLMLLVIALIVLPGLQKESDGAQEAKVTDVPATLQTKDAPEETEASTPLVNSDSTKATPSTDSAQSGGFGSDVVPTYVFDEGNDSPHADEYLYSLSEYYSDLYPQSVRLEAYFGQGNEVVEVPAIIDGLPVTQIYEKCFENRTEIKQVILPETIESIDYSSFYGCANLTQINFPASLTSIGSWSLAHTGFTSVVFPDTVTYIGNGVLCNCDNLETVVVSRGVTEIDYDTFRSNANLKSITIPASVTSINIDALRNSEQAIIIGVKGSYAEKYAMGMAMKFQEYAG